MTPISRSPPPPIMRRRSVPSGRTSSGMAALRELHLTPRARRQNGGYEETGKE
jgi:hypothetical protein